MAEQIFEDLNIRPSPILFISAAVAEGGIFMSGLFIVVVLRESTRYSLYTYKARASIFGSLAEVKSKKHHVQ